MANVITDKVIKTTGSGNIHVMGWNDLFPTPRENQKGRRLRLLKNAEWYKLQHDTNFEGITFRAGSLFKFFETENFGWVVFHPSTITPEGYTPGRLIFKY